MPVTSSALKALRQSRRRETINRRVRSKTKTALDAMKKSPSVENLAGAFSAVDRAVKKNLLHKNKAARMKSALAKLLGKK